MNALFLALLLAAQQPDDVTLRIQQATLLVDSGKVDQAIAALKTIVAEHPDNETAKYELGLAYSAKGDAENCRKIFEPLVDTAKDRVNALGMLGNCLDELGQRDKAIDAYRRGLKLDPTDSQLTFNLAVTVAHQQKLDEARELLKTDTRANPWHASGHLLLGKIFEAQDFRVPAVFSYLHFLAIEASPHAADVAARLQHLLDLGVEKKSEKEINVNVDPNTRKEEGDYSPMEMSLAIVSGGRFVDEKKSSSDFDRVREQVAAVVSIFLELPADSQNYTGAVQRPFFEAMQKEKLVDTFAAIAITPLKLRGTDAWVKAHVADVTRYSEWITPQLKRPGVQLPPK